MKCSRDLPLTSVWKLLIQDYICISQGPMSYCIKIGVMGVLLSWCKKDFHLPPVSKMWKHTRQLESKDLRGPSQYKDRLSRYGIPVLKIRRSRDRLIFNMEIPILVRRHLNLYSDDPNVSGGFSTLSRVHRRRHSANMFNGIFFKKNDSIMVKFHWSLFTRVQLKTRQDWLRSWLNSLRPSDAYMRRWINHHCFRLWLVAWMAPSHYLKQCWNVVNRTLWNKFQ